MRMLVLGAGLQGSACAYDLLQDKEVTEVRLADLHVGQLPEFLAPYSGPRLLPTTLDVRDESAVNNRRICVSLDWVRAPDNACAFGGCFGGYHKASTRHATGRGLICRSAS